MTDFDLSSVLGDGGSARYTTSGTWVHPEPGVPYIVYYDLRGGGGGGACGWAYALTSGSPGTFYCAAPGNLGGRTRGWVLVTTNVAYTIGVGGTGAAARTVVIASASGTLSNFGPGGAGGTTAFGSATASGGSGGTYQQYSTLAPTCMAVYMFAAAIAQPSMVFGGSDGASAANGAMGGSRGGVFVGDSSPPNGGNAAYGYSSNPTAQAGQDAPAAAYGGAGAGGGGCVVNGADGYSATSGRGGNGSSGVIDLSWRRY